MRAANADISAKIVIAYGCSRDTVMAVQANRGPGNESRTAHTLTAGMTFTLDDNAALLKPVRVGDTTAANRIFMAPLTRTRAQADGTPSDWPPSITRSAPSAGVIITEATAVSRGGQRRLPEHARASTPIGISSAGPRSPTPCTPQGGRMFMQLWHVGRMAHPEISGVESVAPSPVAADVTTHTPSGKQPLPVPRALAHRSRSPRSSSSSGLRRAGRSTPAWTVSRSTPPTATCCTSSRPTWSTSGPMSTADRRDQPGPADRRGRRGRGGRDRSGSGRSAHLAGKRRRRHARGRRRQCVRGAAGPDRAAGAGLPARADQSRRRRVRGGAHATGTARSCSTPAARDRDRLLPAGGAGRVGRHRRCRGGARVPGQPRPHRPAAGWAPTSTSRTSRRSTRRVPRATSTTRPWPKRTQLKSA